MRHRRDHRKLSRTSAHRKALLRNLVTALYQYERIETSVAKAKEARRLAERLITFAKRGDIAARRHVARFVMRPDVAHKLFDKLGSCVRLALGAEMVQPTETAMTAYRTLIGHMGSAHQITEARSVLANARRALYSLLAEDEPDA